MNKQKLYQQTLLSMLLMLALLIGTLVCPAPAKAAETNDYITVNTAGKLTADKDSNLMGNLPQTAVEWKNFRHSDVNMAIIDALTPRTAAETALKWCSTTAYLQDWTSTSSLLLVNDKLIFTVNSVIYQLDKTTGAELRHMALHAPDGVFGNAPILYAEGMIFVPQMDGCVQAFCADTLEPLWLSENLGSQCTTPLVYADGYLYGSTGSSDPGRFFCLSVTDEDTNIGTETKNATWTAYDSTHPTGSYWSGALIVGKAVIYGTDAANGSAMLVSRDRLTGELLSQLTLSELGDQRSSIAYADSKAYFTTTGGYLCSAAVDENGMLSGLISTKNSNVTTSTSTPVVYNDVVYYGANGRVVAADATTLTTLREAAFPSANDVKSSGLLTSAYDNAVYLYYTQNDEPGALYAVCDDGAALTCTAIYTPAASNYAIISPICDSDGVIYYRNDAGYLLALERREPGCPVQFSLSPTDATVTVSGQTQTAANTYDLPAGTYSYSVTKSGYTAKNGSFTVSDIDAANHTKKQITVSLSSQPASNADSITVRVQVKTHDDSCNNAYTYKNNASAFTAIVNTSVTLDSGSSVADALITALDEVGLDYEEKSSGYFESIDDMAEFAHGSRSGWLYMVNGTMSSISSRDYELTKNSTVIWFFSDDYAQEYGSEQWSGDNEVVTPAPTVPTADSFIDVAEDAWYYEAVQQVTMQGWMNGIGGDKFAPDALMNRAMLITILYRLSNSPTIITSSSFTDVSAGQWYSDAIAWAQANKLIYGVAGSAFAPLDTLSREQTAALLYRYINYKQNVLPNNRSAIEFSDQDSVSTFATDSVRAIYQAELMNGYPDGSFRPTAPITRAETAQLIYMFEQQ